MHDSLEAAKSLEAEGMSLEVIDLRTIWPWDRERVFASVEKTGRLLVAHESVRAAGFGAEIAASVAEGLHGRLKAPVARVAGPRIPVGYAPVLEAEARVGTEKIAQAARAAISGVRFNRETSHVA
jgi:pyruvate dehydrogenase E1 component beta subunit